MASLERKMHFLRSNFFRNYYTNHKKSTNPKNNMKIKIELPYVNELHAWQVTSP